MKCEKICSMANYSSSCGTDTQNIWSLTSGYVCVCVYVYYMYMYMYIHVDTHFYGVVLKQTNKCLYSFKRDEMEKENNSIRELYFAACIVSVLK